MEKIKMILLIILCSYMQSFSSYSDILLSKNHGEFSNIYLLQDNNLKKITNYNDSFFARYFDYSKEKNILVFIEYFYDSKKSIKHSIKLIDFNNGEIEKIKEAKEFLFYLPDYSDINFIPNSSKIIYLESSNLSKNSKIIQFDLVSKKENELANIPKCYDLKCSYDGNLITFIKDDEVYTMNLKNMDNMSQVTKNNEIKNKRKPIMPDEENIYFIGSIIHEDELSGIEKKVNNIYKVSIKNNKISKITSNNESDVFFINFTLKNTELLISERSIKNGNRLISLDIENRKEKLITTSDSTIEQLLYYEK